MATVVIPLEVPATMPLPESVPTLNITGFSVLPQPDGTVNLTVSVHPGTTTLAGSPLTFSVPALLKFFQDLAAVLPSLLADLQAVFAATVQEDSQK